ncbi:YbaB/EbfC family nucleoid-associated protein [Cryptosporangium sp. NPDC051539]|uniref:YbaB/EbfC family nucleoid-associated protein n=1 Tax=Cryptosporangium sp. NPDC051539 TaxID=3363962 RepID=UPI00379576A6
MDFGDEWIRGWSAAASERAARTMQLAEEVAALSVEARSAGVAVTVAGSGVVTGLRLADAVRGWPVDRLAGEILATMHRAQAGLAERVAEIAARTVGADSETARSLVRSYAARFPAPPSAPADPWRSPGPAFRPDDGPAGRWADDGPAGRWTGDGPTGRWTDDGPTGRWTDDGPTGRWTDDGRSGGDRPGEGRG